MILPQEAYLGEDVVRIARELLGKFLVTEFDGILTSGMIVETEAYRGPDDKACHAYNHRRTARTEVMYGEGGHAYVYLCYGIHHLFNVVTGPKDQAHAVLIRALEPVEHTGQMLLRRRMDKLASRLTAGPGALTEALGIRTGHSGLPLFDPDSPIRIEDRKIHIPLESIQSGTRVGVQYAGTCALRPWRFCIKGSAWVSKAKGAE